ncbi:MAG: V-type ATPase subunit subunit G family protein [Coriobacteriia bacterium]|nr:V-type ATPase subunit subunit G family protein [Coriobacteriia bacterium]MDO9107740.1 V-type ATPase subunit subunit G family protein [Coriobacteriia bacterium]
MEEKVLEEIQFHQDTVSRDANSPLHLIREKEMEISGRVLAAKKEAEEIVATARKKAVEVIQAAEEEGTRLASAHEKTVLADVQKEIEAVREGAVTDIESIDKLVSDRTGKAVQFVSDFVTSV